MSIRLESAQTAYSAPIVSKAMRILRMIVRAQTNPGISDIASKLSLAKSTTHGILAALEASGWVLRDPVTRAYTCGHAVKDLAAVANVRVPLITSARPFLENLSKELREDIFLGVLSGDNLLILDQVETSKELKVTAKPGTRLSMFAGAAGKIFLAHMDREELSRILQSQPLPRFTPDSITSPDQYLAELDRVRQAGIAVDTGEYISNCRAVAAPIFYGKKNRRRMVAGFWLVSLDWHINPTNLKTVEKLAIETGEAISRAISANYG
jgi:DNA-binding IclR family transcriptional regulator